ncbi:MAG TPA: hypothetical protein ENL20_07625 [Candidatus Cloacimonetes bacterium]|nr:hypothetical protein [Candidatus Cloacimonadota bacterium]
MPGYIVFYDIYFPIRQIRKKRKSEFKTYLRSFGPHINLSNNLKIINSKHDLDTISEKLEELTDKEDRIFIAEIKNNFFGNITEQQWKWLMDNIRDREDE